MEQEKSIEAKIAEVEERTSAEIKIAVASYCWGNLLQKAQKIFEKHNLHLTEKRNGVMILLIVKNRELLIYGDKGINDSVGENFWTEIKDEMLNFFKKGDFDKGVLLGLEKAGKKLIEIFPAEKTNNNELNNKIIYC